MSGLNELARAKARYAEAKEIARRLAALNLAPALGVDFYITNISRRAIEAMAQQWSGEARAMNGGGWDWEEIRRRYGNEMGYFDLAVWGPGERLCAVGMCLAKSTYVMAERLEGDPTSDCPLRGKRALILLEATTLYAQKLGRSEIRLESENNHFKNRVESDFGFSLESPRKGSPYYRKEI